MMAALGRRRLVAASTAILAAFVVVLVLAEPAREALHTFLNGLRTSPLELASEDVFGPRGERDRVATDGPFTLSPDAFTVTEIQPATVLSDPSDEDLDRAGIVPVTIAAPIGFEQAPERTLTTGGVWSIAIDIEEFGAFLTSSEVRIPLPRALERAVLNVSGAALITTVWPPSAGTGASLDLHQIRAPRVSGPPELDLELVAEALLREFLPPVIARGTSIRDIPILRQALGLPAPDDADGAAPQVFQLPDGRSIATLTSDDATLVLIGPLDPEALLRVAATARSA